METLVIVLMVWVVLFAIVMSWYILADSHEKERKKNEEQINNLRDITASLKESREELEKIRKSINHT